MSFLPDESRRYGHVPPAQYHVANQQHQDQDGTRRSSFNNVDNPAYLDRNAASNQQHQGYQSQAHVGRTDEELFITSPTGSQTHSAYGSPSLGMAGFQHQYQGQAPPTPSHAAYNPQNFARTQSTSLPYYPAQRYTSPTSPTYPAAPTTNYTPQTYNPAAYASTNPVPTRQASAASNNSHYNYNSYSGSGYGSPIAGQPPSSFTQASPTYPAPQTTQPLSSPPPYGGAHAAPFSTTTAQYDQSYQQSAYPGQYNYGSYLSNNASPAATTSAYSTPATRAPYPTYSQIPVGPNSADPHSFASRASRSDSQTSQASQQSPHPQLSPGLQRHPTNAPLPRRPMDDMAEEPDWLPIQRGDENDAREQQTQESLVNDIISDLSISTDIARRHQGMYGNVPDDDLDRLRRFDSTASTVHSRTEAGVNRFASNASTVNRNSVPTSYDYDEDDSDPEGAAGLLAMQEDADDRRFSGLTFPSYMEAPTATARQSQTPHLPPTAEEQVSTDSDLGPIDLGGFTSSYSGNFQYGNDVSSPPATETTLGGGGRPLPYPDVSVDYAGTGGLQAPQPHRLSFDEGDERVSLRSQQSGSDSPFKEDYPDMFYHPGISNRPLPALPANSDSSSMLSAQSPGPYQHQYPLSAEARLTQQQQVERSISLSAHSTSPAVQAPARSRTDANEERKRALRQLAQQQHAASPSASPYDGQDTGTPPSVAAYDVITLPTGRKRKFQASKLTPADLKRCPEPWALSGVVAWIREMTEEEQYLTRKTIEEGITNLFCAKVPTMNVADAEAVSSSVVEQMYAARIIVPDEDVWVKFAPGQLSGILWQLTGSGCYASKLHENEESAPRLPNGLPMRCYSHHCSRTVKKVNLDELLTEETGKHPSWEDFFGLSMEDINSKHKKEVQRQNILYEIVYGEEDFMSQLDVLRILYRDQLKASRIISANKLDRFIQDVFGKVDAVKEVNKEHLLAQIKYRQKEQAPWISGYSDIFREWIRKARPIYLDFCAQYPYAAHLIRREARKNHLFAQFLDQVQAHPRCNRLAWDTYIRAPIARLQRYGLLLETALKNSIEDNEEKANLAKAIEEIKSATRECDAKVKETSAKVDMLELQSQLVLRPGFVSVLNLDHLGRELIKQGELQRQGSKGVRWVDTHAILFDHYFILAKSVKESSKDKKYDVSKEPIPMPLLFLESMNEDPVSRQNRIAAPLTRAAPTASSTTQLTKIASNPNDRPALEHTGTSNSMGSLTTMTRLTPSNEDGKIIYPFRVKHLGHDVYTLYASSEQDRAAWCDAIIAAKQKHAEALHTQNAEPFRLRVLSDSGFSYDTATAYGKQAGVAIKGTPLDRAMREMEKQFGTGRGPPPVCRATVNCAVSFQAYGKSLIAIGTDGGVFISEATNPRGWTRAVAIGRVTQIAVLEDFNVCLLISEKSLISYPLDVIAPLSSYPAPAHENTRRAPQRLAKDVAFFATARMKDRMLVFYKRKEGMHNTFKVLEPVVQKATEKKSRLFRKGGVSGSTESFRDYDEFYLPTECFSLNVFQTYIAVASAKGLELLTLDKKIPQSIPHNLNLPAIANITQRIQAQRPLGMFRLNDQEFLLAYEDCAVYVDKHGEVSRTLIMEYSGKQKKARGATMYGQYLVLFNEDYVEVRNAENGRMRQVIAGRDVRCIDYGYRGPTGNGQQQQQTAQQAGGLQYQNQTPMQGVMDWRGTVKICMSHPEVPGGQIVLEMVLIDGHAEK